MDGDHDHDVVVLGIGGMGSATAFHLARRGVDVLGIERFDVPHAKGSSHGVTRILRLPQFKHPDYVPLVRRSLDLWTDLEAEHDRQLFYPVGTLDFGPPDSDVFTGSRESCTVHDLEHTVLTGRELTEHPGGLDLPDEYRAVYQPDGGFVHAEQSVVAHVRAAQDRGATIRARERVRDWDADESGVRVVTDRGTYTADTLVTTVGSWTGELFPTLDPLLTPERQVLGWFQPTDPDRFTPENFPVFVAGVPEGNYYGFPSFEVPGFKFGKHHHRNETGPVADVRHEPTREDEAVLRQFADAYAPAGTGPTMRLVDCLYTNTPDEDFLLDVHPDHPNVVVGAGFSGHGFKFATVVGESLADLATAGATDNPIERFAISRFD
jgi:sarcosine oxidase